MGPFYRLTMNKFHALCFSNKSFDFSTIFFNVDPRIEPVHVAVEKINLSREKKRGSGNNVLHSMKEFIYDTHRERKRERERERDVVESNRVQVPSVVLQRARVRVLCRSICIKAKKQVKRDSTVSLGRGGIREMVAVTQLHFNATLGSRLASSQRDPRISQFSRPFMNPNFRKME